MPSKKKPSRTQSRLSSSDSPQTPPPTSLSADEDSIVSSLEEASSRYPHLITKSSFVGFVTDVVPESKGSKVWLSEPSMVASSLAPGSLVSVALAASRGRLTNSFPLSSFYGEWTKQVEFELVDETESGVGNVFAIATVFPSCKVVKNGVQLSSSLSYTMGCPVSGTVLFISPIGIQSLMDLVNECGLQNKKPNNSRLHICNELLLELVPLRGGVKLNNERRHNKSTSEETYGHSENSIISSPKTLLCQSKPSFSGPSDLPSARCEAPSTSSYSKSTLVDSFDIKEVIRDESAKHILQACATSWLYSRVLLEGNIVAIPVLSEVFLFRVISMDKCVAKSNNQDLLEDRSHVSYCTHEVNHVNDPFLINHETKIRLRLPISAAAESPQKRSLSFSEIENEHMKTTMACDISKLGGLHKEYAVLKDIILSSITNTLSRIGLRTTKGVLLHGPPGTGKTTLARLCAIDVGVNIFSVNGPEMISQYYGESEQAMHKVFESAIQAAPSVVFIDELDAIAPARKYGGEELSQRMVATLLNLMDGISRSDGLLVIAATNRPDSIEPALRRPGRFDREIEIGVPSPTQRLDILQTILSEMEHSLTTVQVQHLASATHGFVGADLAALCNEAALFCLRRYAKSQEISNGFYSKQPFVRHENSSDSLLNKSDCTVEMRDSSRNCIDTASSNVSELSFSSSSTSGTKFPKRVASYISSDALLADEQYNLKVSLEDFEKARLKVRPSAMREVVLEVPKVNWEDVGGQGEVKLQLMEAVEWPQKHQDAFKRIGVRPPTGILLFGPPGCSKTLMARAVASEAGLNFLAVKGPELFSKWVGESEKAVRSLFAKARANAPSIIFFDEIDGLAVIRGKENDGISVSDRVMSQLLVELDGLHQRVDVTVIAATNRPDKIDPALLRPGRFDRLLYVGPPSKTDREDIFQIHLRKIPCSSDVNVKELAHLTDGCTGADISLICREAAILAIEEGIDASEVTMRHFKTAVTQVESSEIHSYEELSAKFQRLVQTSHREDADQQDSSKQNPSSSIFNSSSIWNKIKSSIQYYLS